MELPGIVETVHGAFIMQKLSSGIFIMTLLVLLKISVLNTDIENT